MPFGLPSQRRKDLDAAASRSPPFKSTSSRSPPPKPPASAEGRKRADEVNEDGPTKEEEELADEIEIGTLSSDPANSECPQSDFGGPFKGRRRVERSEGREGVAELELARWGRTEVEALSASVTSILHTLADSHLVLCSCSRLVDLQTLWFRTGFPRQTLARRSNRHRPQPQETPPGSPSGLRSGCLRACSREGARREEGRRQVGRSTAVERVVDDRWVERVSRAFLSWGRLFLQ